MNGEHNAKGSKGGIGPSWAEGAGQKMYQSIFPQLIVSKR